MDDIKNCNKVILVLKGATIIPHTITPLLLGKPASIKTLETALEDGGVAIFLQKNGDSDLFDINDLYQYGTYAKIVELARDTKGNIKVLFEGLYRISIHSFVKKDIIYGEYSHSEVPSHLTSDIEFKGLWKQFISYYEKYREYNNKISEAIFPLQYTLFDMIKTVDIVAGVLLSNVFDKQEYIEKNLLEERIYFLVNYINKEINIIDVEKKIKSNLQNQLESSQKEYYLKEQLRAIQKELNHDKVDDFSPEAILKKAREIGIPDVVHQKIIKELNRLEQMQDLSTESSVIKGYIDWLLSIPWVKKSADQIGLIEAKKILDEYHYGLGKVKEQVLEFLAALKYAGDKIKAPIICLIGPPGVGKTSLAKSIAACLNREFVRISLGGVRDEADIRGHRKTYVAAMPGKIIQAFKKVSTVNPVILLDEIDKMSRDLHGDPSSALLEVLDHEQNSDFCDSYLDISYDISQAVYIATANHIENIPYPLLDRFELIYLSSYTLQEKIYIAKSFLLPKLYAEHNVIDYITFSDEAIYFLIFEYTKEAGVRQLTRLLVRVIRKIISKYFLDNPPVKKTITVDKNLILEFLKTPYYKFYMLPQKKDRVGIVNGLAWTEMGGDVLEIETVLTPGKGNIQLTGQLGEVMQESAQTALTYVKSRYKAFKISKKKFADFDIHVHVPEGATPKDGPSAGIAMCTALVSLFTNISVKKRIAMTGEITLQGRILAIGGIKEKVLAAELQNYDLVVLPLQNKLQAEEVIEEVGNLKLKIAYCDHMDEVLKIVLKKKLFEDDEVAS
jgi:ATP-dependent Lon protease